MSTPTGTTMLPTRPTESRRRRRTPSVSSSSSSSDSDSGRATLRGEAHYRDVLLLLQSEFARVVAALETRASSLQQHNEALESEVATLRDALREQEQRGEVREAELQRVREQQAMQREESDARAVQVAQSERKWRQACEELRAQLQMEQKQRELEREKHESELQRAAKELENAAQRLSGEQQTNAAMSQELQLLQCRVDTAVATSRSFEARLQQLKELKRDEKADFEAHVLHLKKRLEDKKQQNQYLTEALMDKENRRAMRKKEELKEPGVKKPSSRRVARDHDELQSHAPTSPTSSASPMLSPTASSFTTSRQAVASVYASPSSLALPQQPHRETTTKTSRTTRSDRLQRELEGLRRKISACMAPDQ